MSDAELSRDLALALGYYPESVRVVTRWAIYKHDICEVYRTHRYASPNGPDSWHPFDYRASDVCLPLIKWLMREHDLEFCAGVGDFIVWSGEGRVVLHADTLEKAVARAVIAVKGEKK